MTVSRTLLEDGDFASHHLRVKMTTFTASALSLVAAGIHLWMVPHHLAEWWGYGLFFVLGALCQALYGLSLLFFDSRRLFLIGIAGNLTLVSFYMVTRTSGIPFFGPHAWEVHEVGVLDPVCVVAELALVAVLVFRAGVVPAAVRWLALGAVQSFGTGAVLHALHVGTHDPGGLSPASHWFLSSVLLVPLFAQALWLAGTISSRLPSYLCIPVEGWRGRLTWSLSGAVACATAGVVADEFAAGQAALNGAGSFASEAVLNAAVVLGTAFILLAATSAVSGSPWEPARNAGYRRPRTVVVIAGLASGMAFVAGPDLAGQIYGGEFTPAAGAQASGVCTAATYDRSYSVSAVNVTIPYNRWGGVDEHGQLFVLQDDKQAVKNWSLPLAEDSASDPANNRRLRPRPLVIRANAGECVKVNFTNELNNVGGDGLPNNPRASMKVFGLSYDVQTSDGSAVGYNADTTVPNRDDPATSRKENRIVYYWQASDREGTFLFRDQAALAGSEANSGSIAHGLYGAFVVEPAGSAWRDPETGDSLYSGVRDHRGITKQSGDPYVDADIVPGVGRSFREIVQVSQDELPGSNGFGFNYGAEPSFNRVATNPAGEGSAGQFAPDSIGEETSLSSWTYGDPALIKLASGLADEGWLPQPDGNGGRVSREDCGLPTSCYVSNVTHSYVRDPSKVRFVHAGVKETHVFHMHAHQWRVEPRDKNSSTVDSQTYGPGEAFTAELLFGAGSKPGTIGDSIFHCHLYPHFADGFWALFRVHDVLEDGTGKTPDGVNVRSLEPLPDRSSLSTPTAENPGYPRFIPGKFGWRAPQPPGGVSEPRTDDPTTPEDESDELQPAMRVVAGNALDPALMDADDSTLTQTQRDIAGQLRVEKSVQDRGSAPKPGAPFVDPCPASARKVTYNVSVIQTDITYNEAGWHDRQGRILVLDSDLNEDGTIKGDPEPLFIRVNAGDCVDFNLTNRLPNFFGGDEFVQLAQTNMAGQHIHLVKFDVLGSDGASNGWNYQQAAFSRDQMEFNRNRDAEGRIHNCDYSVGCRIPDPPDTDGDGKPDWNAAEEAAEAGANPGQTIHERWYADYELRTVFTHDHHFPAIDQNKGLFGGLIVEPGGMDFRNPKTGRFYQPINDPSHASPTNGPVCGSSCEGNAAGEEMDVIGPGPDDDFRELGLAIQDFVSLHEAGPNGAPIEAPDTPEVFPDEDPGIMGINYRNAPFSLRDTDRSGNPSDPAHVFSSTVHGDPETPILEAYSEDPVRLRLLQGSQEEQHVFTVHGMRWRQEPDDPESPLVNAMPIGISEAFDFEVPRITCGPGDASCAGDYLYSTTATDDLYLGAWGLLRARGKEVPSLLPLPDNVPQAEGQTFAAQSLTPPEANSPGAPCPANAPIRSYSVVAMDGKLVYNGEGDNDPYGLFYALAEDEAAIRDGTRKPRPLVLRANEGDCIEVRLTNKLSASWRSRHGNAGTRGDPVLPTETADGTPAGLRVSLHPQLVTYDVRGSDGTAVGYNRDQTVAPGESRLYRWYADEVSPGEIGATNLTDFGDVRGHRHHGLFAGLNIEPRGSTYHDPRTGKEIRSGVLADIRVPNAKDFREFTTFFQDGLNLHDANGEPIEDPTDHPPTPEDPLPDVLDAEDQGEKGFDYRSSPFVNRIGEVPATGLSGMKMAHVFDSRMHGDPDTHIFRTYAGDPVRMRVLQGSDKPRQHSFQVSGHSWMSQPGDPGSTLIGAQGGIGVGRNLNIHLSGAGSTPGDYRYGCGVDFHHLSGGLWGIMRVYRRPTRATALSPTPIGQTDDPLAGGHPLLPLEVSGVVTSPVQVVPGAENSVTATDAEKPPAQSGGKDGGNQPASRRERAERKRPESGDGYGLRKRR